MMLKPLQNTLEKPQLKLYEKSPNVSSSICAMQAFHRIQIWQNKTNRKLQKQAPNGIPKNAEPKHFHKNCSKINQ